MPEKENITHSQQAGAWLAFLSFPLSISSEKCLGTIYVLLIFLPNSRLSWKETAKDVFFCDGGSRERAGYTLYCMRSESHMHDLCGISPCLSFPDCFASQPPPPCPKKKKKTKK